jgi:hypothetical protein
MPKDLKLSMVTYPKFPDLIPISEFKSNLKKWFGVILIWKNAPSMYRMVMFHNHPLKILLQ